MLSEKRKEKDRNGIELPEYTRYGHETKEAVKDNVKNMKKIDKAPETKKAVETASKITAALTPDIQVTGQDVAFPVSTSHYTKETVERLNKILNKYPIEKAVIVAGGGTLPLQTISILRKENPWINEINCIDINPNALVNLRNIIDIYNSSKNNEEYIENISKYAHQYDGKKHSQEQIDRWLDMGVRKYGKPDMNGDIELKLVNSEIREFIPGIKDKGKYFIDLSNTVNYIENFLHKMPWTSIAKSKEILDTLIENQNILDGSVIYISNYRRPPLILIKQNGKLYQTDPDDSAQNKGRSTLGIVIGLTLDMLYYFAFIYTKENIQGRKLNS